jgi:serine phosphatase RsbU (regulator of sigma subunit)
LRAAIIGGSGLLFFTINSQLSIIKVRHKNHPDLIKAYENYYKNQDYDNEKELDKEFIRAISKTQDEFESRLEYYSNFRDFGARDMIWGPKFDNEYRAKYIFGFLNQITWTNGETNLTIGVLEPDTTLSFKNLRGKTIPVISLSEELRLNFISENIAGKTIDIISLKTLEELPPVNLLYVNKNWNSNINFGNLMTDATEKGFLLITEGATLQESMINFVSVRDVTFYVDNIYYEVNEAALQKAGFNYLPALIQIGAITAQIKEHSEKMERQNTIFVLGSLFILSLIILGGYIFSNYMEKRKVNRVLKSQNEEIIQHRDLIAHQNKEITDSIIYARRIQNAVLPAPKMLKDYLEMYIFYRPRDIVSGDFYWMSKKEDKLIIVAADCTGHGVPGAFMSMLGIAFLNEIVNKEDELYANEILNKLRDYIIKSLHQSRSMDEGEEHTKDGMDIALCIIDYTSMTLQFAGAYNPLILIRNKELTEVKADKMPIAYSDDHGEKKFTNNLISLFSGDCIYMFSDGYADQFGGSDEKCKKYSGKRLKSTLLEICDLPMKEQEKIMAQTYDEWKGPNEQIDDVLLIGIRI